MTTFGVDHAWGRPGPAALKQAGAHFVCRYLSHDTTGKNLTRAEAGVLSDNGIWIVVVWESTRDRALAGRSAGATDARAALSQAQACGMPAGRPIYFAVDWDASAGQQAAIHAYLDGAASVLGRARVGLYAGYYVIKRAFDAHKIAWGWQTYAWSGGHWDSRAQVQQYSNGHELNGVGIDYDRAMTSDYGQWRVGVTPTPEEDDMPTADEIATAVVRKGINARGRTVGQALQTADDGVPALRAQLEAQAATIDKLVDAVGQAGAFDPEELKREIREAIESIEIKIDVPETEPAEAG